MITEKGIPGAGSFVTFAGLDRVLASKLFLFMKTTYANERVSSVSQ